MSLRKGKSKSILDAAVDSALLAVEIYNKPRTTFRSQAYITLMIIAWTRLFHAYFHNTIGDRYYYKKKNGRYETVDGERKAWELNECLKKYNQLPDAIKLNLEFFIKLRNKIEHRHIDPTEIDISIFGECQSLLFNFENYLVKFFGKNNALNEALVYSLQFSHLRTNEQTNAGKSVLSTDTIKILNFVNKFRESIPDDTFNSYEYSIKLIQIPRISNTNRADAAIEFVKWNELNDADKEAYKQVAVLIKDRVVRVEGANVERLKPGQIVNLVKAALPDYGFNNSAHIALWKMFNIRPSSDSSDPFETNNEFCHYDQPHQDYVYEKCWADFIVHFLQTAGISKEKIIARLRQGEKFNIDEFRN